jgi:hypothetical protein
VRKIPEYIGKVAIPESRTTTIQLLECWGKLLDEYKNIEPLFNDLKKLSPTDIFTANAQDIAMHLATINDEKKLEVKRKDLIFVGTPKTQIGYINCKVATVLHRFFDEPNYVIKGKHPPKTPEEIEAMKKLERELLDKDKCCPEDLKKIEESQTQ